MELEECIKDAIETSMKEYIQSAENINHRDEITSSIAQFRESLTLLQQKQLNILLDKLTTYNGLFTAEAYKNGVVDGIELSVRRRIEAEKVSSV